MILDREHFSFLVQVIDSHLNAAGGYAEGRVLDILKFLNKGWRVVGDPNGICMHEKGPDKGHIGDKYDFLLLTLVGTSKGLEDVDTGIRGEARMTIDLTTWALNLQDINDQ